MRPFGIDVEAWPFVAAAASASPALLAAASLRPNAVGVLALAAAAMLAFAVLDVREIVHRLDIDGDGLAVLAGPTAPPRVAAGVVAAVMAWRASRRLASSAGTPGTIAT